MMLTAALVLVLAQAAPPARWDIAVISELSRERLTYHIENPSSYSGPDLVPHFFEQTYNTDNLWLGARLVHPFGGERGQFEFALTPQRTRRADDFDTFFLPDGNVVVTGTTGGASVRSWRVAERFRMARARGVNVDFEYSYRHHRARYHDGDGITTTTQPPSVTHRLVTTRETTTSGLHEPAVVANATRPLGRGRLEIDAAVAPASLARLTVDLPDKYPGRLLVFYSAVTVLRGGVAFVQPVKGVSMRVAVRAGRTVSWRDHSQLDARTVTVSLDINPR